MPKKNYIYDPTAIHQHTVGMQLQYCYRDYGLVQALIHTNIHTATHNT